MGDPETSRWIDAARTYRRLLRRGRWLGVGFFGSVYGFAALFCAASGRGVNPAIPPLLFFLFLAIFGALWVAAVATSLNIREFACPRCDKRFIGSSLWFRSPAYVCRHCGLDLGPRATASKEKATQVEDFWD